jgi:hypothetical protein
MAKRTLKPGKLSSETQEPEDSTPTKMTKAKRERAQKAVRSVEPPPPKRALPTGRDKGQYRSHGSERRRTASGR